MFLGFPFVNSYTIVESIPNGIPAFKRFIITPETNFNSLFREVSFSIIEAIIIASFFAIKR